MNEREKELDRRLNKLRRRAFAAELRREWRGYLLAVVLVAVVAGMIAMLVSPPRFQGFVFGRWVGDFITPTKNFPPNLLVTVKLDSGATISLTMPNGVMPRPGGRMKIAIYERGFAPFRLEIPKFDSYVETTGGNLP